jgi:hypothetical protein
MTTDRFAASLFGLETGVASQPVQPSNNRSMHAPLHATGRGEVRSKCRCRPHHCPLPCRPCSPTSIRAELPLTGWVSAAVCGSGLRIADAILTLIPCLTSFCRLHGPSSFASHKRAAVAARAEKSGFGSAGFSIPPFFHFSIAHYPLVSGI